jgi:hypothetical protein
MATQNKLSGIIKLEKQVKTGGDGSEAANEENMANNGELMVAIMGAITAYIQTEQQTSSNADYKGAD